MEATDSPGQGPVATRCNNLTSELPTARVALQRCPILSTAECVIKFLISIVKNKIYGPGWSHKISYVTFSI